MRYASLEKEISKIAKENNYVLDEVFKEAINIIERLNIYHFNGLKVYSNSGIIENNLLKIELINKYKKFYILTIDRYGNIFKINKDDNSEFIIFELKKDIQRKKINQSENKIKLFLTFNYENDIIKINSIVKKNKIFKHERYKVKSYINDAREVLDNQLNLELFIPDDVSYYTFKSLDQSKNMFNPTNINNVLNETAIIHNSIKKSPYSSEKNCSKYL